MNEKKFAIVVSNFNEEITSALLQGALQRLAELNIPKTHIHVTHVPGAVEIPLMSALLAKTQHYQAIITLGAVIQGDTDHYDYVCQMVSAGCMEVMLKYEIPIIFGILTTQNEEQARDRVGGKEGHKGREAVDAAVMMLNNIALLA